MHFSFADNKLSVQDDHGHWLGEVSFPWVDKEHSLAVIERVFVVPAARGQGLADQLMGRLVTHAEQTGMRFKIMCPYAKRWFYQHQEKQQLLPLEDRFNS